MISFRHQQRAAQIWLRFLTEEPEETSNKTEKNTIVIRQNLILLKKTQRDTNSSRELMLL